MPGLLMTWNSTASIMPLHTGVFSWPSTMRHGRPMKQMLSQSLRRAERHQAQEGGGCGGGSLTWLGMGMGGPSSTDRTLRLRRPGAWPRSQGSQPQSPQAPAEKRP